jgi:tRNA-modifying protein YgfZ
MNKPFKILQYLTDRAIFKIIGNDAKRFLNGQISQDVSLASDKVAVYSIIANFKGKLVGDFFIRIYAGELLIDACVSQRESLFQRLDKYLIADDAEIIDVSDDYYLCHVIGECDHAFSQSSWECSRYGLIGKDYLFKKSENLPLVSLPEIDLECEKLRISNKIPKWGNELDEDTLPPEANLESRAISYTKGCYTGQEVISRMKSAGKTNRHLVGFLSQIKIQVPRDLSVAGNDVGKPAAVITSACEMDGKWIGLGFRTRKAELAQEFFDASGNSYIII